jgi:N-acetylglucosamine-6-phosphate deacetylase
VRPFDIQVNGYAGVDFCSASLTLEQCRTACDALAADRVDGILATVITDSVEAIAEKLAQLVAFREADPAIAKMIVGFHVEGPFISGEPGFVGAHAREHVLPATPEAMRRIVDAGGGLLRLVTLAPEHDAGFATTAYLARQGVAVAAGHTDASLDCLRGAIDAGLTLVTHLGNGCPTTLARHDNVIQRVLALRDRLCVCFIPDGVHVPFFALANYVALVGLDRCIMVTDAISAARLGPGVHELSGAPVEIDAAGVARRPGSANLAGSTVTMPRVRENLARHLGLAEAEIARLIDANPRRALGIASPTPGDRPAP